MENQDQRAIIATNIKKYIQHSGLTQKEFAAKIGIVPSTLSDYISLRIMPSQGIIQKMADFFDIDKSDIDTTYKDKLPLNLDRLIDEAIFYKTEVIDPNDRQFIKSILDASYQNKNT